MSQGYGRVKAACYATNICMSVVGNLPPLLFLTFRDFFGISYSLLGLLVLINFCTQLGVDLLFSFFSHKINLGLMVRLTPVIAAAGLVLYAAAPIIFPSAVYAGLVLGTVIFSSASGLAEVLISPVIAAIPAENPDREMSKLHSIYAWGVVGTIPVSTLFLLFVGQEYWQWLVLGFTAVPIIAAVLYMGSTLPPLQTPRAASGVVRHMRNPTLWLCVGAIFLGGAAECTMAQWASGYIECALGIDKIWGDLFGVTVFALTLGIGRTVYAKCGKNIERILLLGAVGAAACYLTATFTSNGIIGLIACGLTGLCVSMMWPGSLISAEHRIPDGGVLMFALMAAGGDLGASVGPQLVGIITDGISTSSVGIELATQLGITAEALGMKAGMLVGSLFPLAAIAVFGILWHKRARTADSAAKQESTSHS